MSKLTALAVKAAVQPGRYHDGKGLMLFVRPGGSRSWVLRTQADGKRRDFGLGADTEVGLAEARDRADVIRKQFKSGIDPIEARRAARAALVTVPTFEEAARTLYEEQKSSWRNAKHRAQWIS